MFSKRCPGFIKNQHIFHKNVHPAICNYLPASSIAGSNVGTQQRCDVSSQGLHQLCKFYDQLSFPFLFFSLLRMKDYHHSVYLLFSRWIHDIYLFREPSISISPLSFWFHRSFKYSLIYLLIYEAILFAPFQPLNLKIRLTSHKWKLNSIDTILITRIIQNYNKYI